MTDRPNLELPQRPAVRRTSGAAGGMILALVAVLVVLQVISLVTMPRQSMTHISPGEELLSATEHKELALKLEDKNLPVAAADAWSTYLREASLQGNEASKVLLQIGKLKQESGDYQGAIHQFYLAERLAAGGDEELSRNIAMRVRECFQKLGQYGDLAREMAERAAPASGDTSLSGQQVVAEIAGERITVADFDRLVQDQIEQEIKAQWGLTPAEADAFRQRAHERLADPQAKARQLQQIVVTRVLAEEARQSGLDESPAFRERLVATADSLLASTLVASEIAKRATITPQDVERYFEANKDRYAEPATTTIAHIRVETREEADDLLARIEGGEAFESLAREHSKDEATREVGGKLPTPVLEQGENVPGIAPDGELHRRIWETQPGEVLMEPYEAGGGWEVIQVLERKPRVEKSLDDVRDRVESDTQLARRQEVTRQYIDELLQQAGVKMYPEAFTMRASAEKDETQ